MLTESDLLHILAGEPRTGDGMAARAGTARRDGRVAVKGRRSPLPAGGDTGATRLAGAARRVLRRLGRDLARAHPDGQATAHMVGVTPGLGDRATLQLLTIAAGATTRRRPPTQASVADGSRRTGTHDSDRSATEGRGSPASPAGDGAPEAPARARATGARSAMRAPRPRAEPPLAAPMVTPSHPALVPPHRRYEPVLPVAAAILQRSSLREQTETDPSDVLDLTGKIERILHDEARRHGIGG